MINCQSKRLEGRWWWQQKKGNELKWENKRIMKNFWVYWHLPADFEVYFEEDSSMMNIWNKAHTGDKNVNILLTWKYLKSIWAQFFNLSRLFVFSSKLLYSIYYRLSFHLLDILIRQSLLIVLSLKDYSINVKMVTYILCNKIDWLMA